MDLETQTALIGLGGAVLGSAASIVTTLVLHRRDRDKFARERLWDARREAYTGIIAAVAAIERQTLRMALKFNNGQAHTYYGSNAFRADAQIASKMREELVRSEVNNRIIISAEMRIRLGMLIRNTDLLQDRAINPPDELYDELYGSYTLAAAEVLEIAQKELGVPN